MSEKEVKKVKVADSADLAEGERLVVDIDTTTIGLFRVKGNVYAYKNSCPHQGGPVCQGLIIPRVLENIDENKEAHGMRYDSENLHIVCPWHGSEFRITSGEHATLSKMRLRAYPVSEEGGDIYVEISK